MNHSLALTKEMTEKFSPESINQLNEESFISRLGIRCTHVEEGLMEATMPVNENNCQPLKMLHGGASLTLAETLAGCGSYVLEKGNKWPWGIQVNGTHVSSVVMGDSVRAVAKLIHKGHSTHLWDVNIYAQSTGKLVSTVRVTNKLGEKK